MWSGASSDCGRGRHGYLVRRAGFAAREMAVSRVLPPCGGRHADCRPDSHLGGSFRCSGVGQRSRARRDTGAGCETAASWLEPTIETTRFDVRGRVRTCSAVLTRRRIPHRKRALRKEYAAPASVLSFLNGGRQRMTAHWCDVEGQGSSGRLHCTAFSAYEPRQQYGRGCRGAAAVHQLAAAALLFQIEVGDLHHVSIKRVSTVGGQSPRVMEKEGDHGPDDRDDTQYQGTPGAFDSGHAKRV